MSCSRNSGDVRHHAWCSVTSNGVWFAVQILMWSTLWRLVENGSLWLIGVADVLYKASITLGSCWMMARMLGTETGKQKVGAR